MARSKAHNSYRHYRATRLLHELLLNAVRAITGKEVQFLQWNGTGPAQPQARGRKVSRRLFERTKGGGTKPGDKGC